tara:strand:- start:71530 stop:71718 length:189 start_codon:yes stop_codon:yes gene_type:complete
MSGETFADQIRQEIIDNGDEDAKLLMDYIDDRIKSMFDQLCADRSLVSMEDLTDRIDNLEIK